MEVVSLSWTRMEKCNVRPVISQSIPFWEAYAVRKLQCRLRRLRNTCKGVSGVVAGEFVGSCVGILKRTAKLCAVAKPPVITSSVHTAWQMSRGVQNSARWIKRVVPNPHFLHLPRL